MPIMLTIVTIAEATNGSNDAGEVGRSWLEVVHASF